MTLIKYVYIGISRNLCAASPRANVIVISYQCAIFHSSCIEQIFHNWFLPARKKYKNTISHLIWVKIAPTYEFCCKFSRTFTRCTEKSVNEKKQYLLLPHNKIHGVVRLTPLSSSELSILRVFNSHDIPGKMFQPLNSHFGHTHVQMVYSKIRNISTHSSVYDWEKTDIFKISRFVTRKFVSVATKYVKHKD